MNLVYGEVIEIWQENGMNIARVRIAGALKKVSLDLLTAVRCGDRVCCATAWLSPKIMCLAIPGKLIEIANDANGVRMGKANFGGIVKQVCLEYTPEVQMGDYVLVHVGFALSKVDEEEAKRTYDALQQLDQLGELETPDVLEPTAEDHAFFNRPSRPAARPIPK